MTNNPDQLSALINLLDEPDDKTFDIIREKIFAFGEQAVPTLETAWENSFDSLVQSRIEWIIHQIQQDGFRHQLIDWMKLGSSDLLKGFLLISRTHYPDLNAEEITVVIEQMKMDAWLELNDNLTALENVKVLNHIFYDMHKFEGNRINLYAPTNQYINTVLETRKGSPLTLGILYLILAQRLNLPIQGVNLPQHFILCYTTELYHFNTGTADVLFYINPFNKGAVFTRKEIDLFIRQMQLKPEPSFYAPCTNVDIIQRLISNMILTYTQLGNPEKVDELNALMELMKGAYKNEE
ncbi:MAG: transglutaminase family protein [Bacteroidales bacterium]|nr:transglutaminase family protein [Bacteroidales bacterium]